MYGDDSNPVGAEFVGTIVVDAVGGEGGGSSQWIQLRHKDNIVNEVWPMDIQ